MFFLMLQSKSSSILIFTSTSSLHFSQFPSGLYGHQQVILTPLGLARPRYLVSQRVFSGAGLVFILIHWGMPLMMG